MDKADYKQLEQMMEKYSDKIKENILNELASRDAKNSQISNAQLDTVMQNHSNTLKAEILAQVTSLDGKNTQITNIQWYMALGLGVMLAAPSFVDKQNPASNWWTPVFMFLAGYFLFIFPGLELFYQKHFNKHKRA